MNHHPSHTDRLSNGMKLSRTSIFSTLFVIFCLVTAVYAATVLTFERVSVTSAGVEGNGYSYTPDISATDGRYVVFTSEATNLVANDTNARNDIFVYDRTADTIERVNVSSAGVQANNGSSEATISADGRYVAFASIATNLIAGDANAVNDIFVYDRNTDTVERVSLTDALGEANLASTRARISSDGRYVAFASAASNLVAGDGNGLTDVFLYDRTLDILELISQDGAGTIGNGSSDVSAISSDGNLILFYSNATNLVVDDTNGVNDIFVYNRATDVVELITDGLGIEGDGDSSGADFSSDGRYVAFASDATNFVGGDINGVADIFVYDRTADTIERVDMGDSESSYSVNMSADGQYVVFTHEEDGGAGTDTDVYRYDRIANTLLFVNDGSTAGVDGDLSDQAAISSDGSVIALVSYSPDLVADDTNDVSDVFVYDANPAVADATPPVITRLGSSPVSLTVGDSYTDAGATALDETDGDITADIVTVNPVNTAVAGTYTVTYNVSDAALNAATEVTRTVNVAAPVAVDDEDSGSSGSTIRHISGYDIKVLMEKLIGLLEQYVTLLITANGQ